MAATHLSEEHCSLASEARKHTRVLRQNCCQVEQTADNGKPRRNSVVQRTCKVQDNGKPRRNTVASTSRAQVREQLLPVLLRRSSVKSGPQALCVRRPLRSSTRPVRATSAESLKSAAASKVRQVGAARQDQRIRAASVLEVPIIDLLTNTVLACNGNVEDLCDHESKPPEPTAASECCAPSPTSEELTESALQRSKELLNQLVQMNLDQPLGIGSEDLDQPLGIGGEDCMETADAEGNAAEFLCSSIARLGNDDETVRVPKIMMDMLMEMWEELHAKKISGHETEMASLTKSNLPSKTDNCIASSASTQSPKSEISWDDGSTVTGQSSPRIMPRSPLPSSRATVSPAATPRTIPRSPLPSYRATASPVVTPQFLSTPCTIATPPSSGSTLYAQPPNFALGLQPASAVRPIAVSRTVTVTTSWVVF